MSEDETLRKPIRSVLGPLATELLDRSKLDSSVPVPTRLEAAIQILQDRAAHAEQFAQQTSADQIDPRLDRIEAKLDALTEHAPSRRDLALVSASHDAVTRAQAETRAALEHAISEQTRYFVAELKNVHISINILRDQISMVILALNDEELEAMINMANAQIDALIAPLKHQTYDAAVERAKLHAQIEQRQAAAIRAQEGGLSDVELTKAPDQEEKER